jgi:hypothetical protein
MSNNVPTRPSATICCVARLFVCGDALNSRRARENLQRLRETLSHVQFEVEVIDVDKTPQTALDQGIFVNPALQVLEPEPGLLVYGDLSDLQALVAMFPKGDKP